MYYVHVYNSVLLSKHNLQVHVHVDGVLIIILCVLCIQPIHCMPTLFTRTPTNKTYTSLSRCGWSLLIKLHPLLIVSDVLCSEVVKCVFVN